MSSLKDKLSRLDRVPRSGPTRAVTLEANDSSAPEAGALEAHHRFGEVSLELARHAHGSMLAALALDASLSKVDPERLVYLDTETTGLSQGAGTLAFVIGLGYWSKAGFHVEQLVLKSPADEQKMLRALLARLDKASGIVTFNGKSFDVPLLRTRCVLNRIHAGLPVLPHFDLVHCSRRIFRRSLSSFRLTAVERALAGFSRVGDISGEEAPLRYFSFLRTRDERHIQPVVEHNRLDVLSMVAITGVLASAWNGERLLALTERLGLAETAFRLADDERALGWALEIAQADCAPAVLGDAWALAARIYKRLRRHADTAHALGQALDAYQRAGHREAAAEIHLALAKALEHRLKAPALAMAHAEKTLAAEGASLHQRRLTRLKRKLSGRPAPVTSPLPHEAQSVTTLDPAS